MVAAMTTPFSTRRDFLKQTGGVLGAAALSPSLLAASQGKTPVGLQLYCVRAEFQKDPASIPRILGELSKMGYQVVEFAGFVNQTPAQWKKWLDDSGLKVEGHHTGWNLLQGDALKKTIDDNAIVGNKQLIVPSLGAARTSPRDTFMKTIEQINAISATLKPLGMRIGFHSEADFFKDIDGARPWDILVDNTEPDVVMQLDTGNVQTARPEGVDVVQVFKRNPGRIKTMHVKPFSKTKPAAFVGEDELPWASIVATSQAQKIEYYIIEYERPEVPPMDALKANLAGLRKFFPA
jgi:sugar phosphate isomerase/epimerase